MDLDISGRSYLVTGASRGLGYAVAEVLAQEGARVTVSSRDPEALAAAAKKLGPGASWIAADNADPQSAARAVAAAVEHGGGRLDGLLISVGGPPPSPAAETDDEQWRGQFESLFIGALRLVRQAIAVMGEGGVIGFVLSSSVRNPIPGLAVSNALRPALAMTAKTLADELGPRGIRVLGFIPGQILTERIRDLDAIVPPQEALRAIPLGRRGTPAEFGRVTAFMMSPAASYVTGSVISVDGGMARSV